MKAVLLALSLVANLALAVSLFRPAPAHSPVPEAAPASKPDLIPVTEPAGVRNVTQVVTNTVTRKIDWSSVESPNYREYIKNLRSVGCPEETIRDIIVADVNKLYDQKRKALPGAKKKFEYWKPGFAWAMGQPDDIEAMEVLNKEKTDLLRALGIEPDLKTAMSTMMNPMDSMFDFLPEDKKGRMVEMMMDMQAKMAKQMKDGGQPDQEDMIKIQKDMEAAVAKMLTPEENKNYQLRMSMTANMMRMQIAGFDPSEKEFLTVFELRKEFDDEFSPMSANRGTKEEKEKRKQAEKELNEKIKAALDDGRYADYEMSKDYNFQAINRAAKSADLGTAEAKKVYEMKKLAEKSAQEIRGNKSLDSDQRKAALEGIRSESEQAIKGVLGEKGWKNYGRGYGLSWMDRIHREPTPPKKTAQ